jgi:hypothetical protein
MRILSWLLTLTLMAACANARSAGAPGEAPATGAEAGRGQRAGAGAGTGAGATRRPSASGHGSTPPPNAAGAGGLVAGAGGLVAGDASVQADVDHDADGGSPADPDRLCDGELEIRLLYTAGGGGLVEDTFHFTNPFGFFFLAIDGKCRYYLNSHADCGIVAGVLETSDEQQLSAALHWRDLAAWSAQNRMDGSCPDAGLVMLGRSNAVATCSCGCDPNAPAGLADALQRAHEWLMQLEARGQPLAGPVSGLAVPTEVAGRNDRSVDWPLARSMSSIADLIVLPGDARLGQGPYARFEDPAETAQLRALRSERAEARMSAGTFWVREEATLYNVVVRDELPANVAESLVRLRQSWPVP